MKYSNNQNIIFKELGFDRAIDIDFHTDMGVNTDTIELAKEFDIDKVYFCTNDENSSPAVFLKEVNSFDITSLKQIAEIQKKIWNYKKVLFLYVYTETEIRIYNCAEKPVPKQSDEDKYKIELEALELKRAETSDKESFSELVQLFSSIAIDTGIIWSLEKASSVRNKIKLQRRVDKFLIESLVKTAQELQKQNLSIDLINKIMMRSLFLLYLEDRGATESNFYSQFKTSSKSYFDILEDVDATYNLYEKLANRFNGSLFTLSDNEVKLTQGQLQLIKKCFISGNDGSNQATLFPKWRLFNFKIIPIELLSEIYENFLAKINPNKKKDTGTFYTPPSLVELVLNDKLPVGKQQTNYNIKVLDPACGSGIFLVESFKRLVKRYENSHGKKLTDFEKLKELLTSNVFGFEYQSQAIKVAAFSLYLALLDNLNPKTIWQDEQNKFPALIYDPNDPSLKSQGSNLFRRDTIENIGEIDNLEFDLIVGNPPFGTKNLLSTIRNYCDKEGFAKEMVLPFMHKAIRFAPHGEIALIFNTKVLTNTGSTYQKFRKWLFNDNYVEKVYNFSILRKAPKNFGGQLFGGATGPISIIYYQKDQPLNPSNRIVYYAPKTYVKSNVLEGVTIDSTDVKYLPREECQKPDTKIWKVAMWGGMRDWELVKQLSNKNKYNDIKSFNKRNGIESGVGFQLLTKKDDRPKITNELWHYPYVSAQSLHRYFTSKNNTANIKFSIKTPKAISFYLDYYSVNSIHQIDKLDAFRRLGDIKAYKHPHVLVKKGLENNSTCASLVTYKCVFRDGVYGFYIKDVNNTDSLKILLAFLNSKLASYFLFLTISSYGIEREQIMKREFLSLPISQNIENDLLTKIVAEIDQIAANSFFRNVNDETINNLVNESLQLNKNDKYLIHDTINYSIDLFHKGKKSRALRPVCDVKYYASLFCDELNNFLQSQEMFANAVIYDIAQYSPLMAIKVVFEGDEKDIFESDEHLIDELKQIDKSLWEQKSENIYFRKKLNYKLSDDTYFIVRPNQMRFWTKSMAMEDASELILEILNEED